MNVKETRTCAFTIQNSHVANRRARDMWLRGGAREKRKAMDRFEMGKHEMRVRIIFPTKYTTINMIIFNEMINYMRQNSIQRVCKRIAVTSERLKDTKSAEFIIIKSDKNSWRRSIARISQRLEWMTNNRAEKIVASYRSRIFMLFPYACHVQLQKKGRRGSCKGYVMGKRVVLRLTLRVVSHSACSKLSCESVSQLK